MTTAHTDNLFNHLNTDNHQNNQLPNLNINAKAEIHKPPFNTEAVREIPQANSDRSRKKVNTPRAPQQRRVLIAAVVKKEISGSTVDNDRNLSTRNQNNPEGCMVDRQMSINRYLEKS